LAAVNEEFVLGTDGHEVNRICLHGMDCRHPNAANGADTTQALPPDVRQ
jgi:hypothetical protein